MENITTIGSLLREVWRYEPDILKLIFEFLFVPLYKDILGKCRYVIALPKPGTTTIDEFAFYCCSSLQSVTIPKSVTIIGYRAFSGCSSFQSITIPNSVTTIGFFAFSCCSSLQSVTIPDSVTSIGDFAFSDCSSFQSITIPNSVITIDRSAFRGCKKLNQASIPKHLEKRVRELKVFPEHTKLIVR